MSDAGETVKAEGANADVRPPARAFRVPAEIRTLLGLLGVIGLFLVVLGWRGQLGAYLKWETVQLVMNQNAIQMVVALGMLLVIVSGGIDLSVGSVAALSAVSTVLAYREALERTGSAEIAAAAAVCAGVGAGGLCGLANGMAISWLRLTPFVATLGMLSIARGLAFWLSGRTNITVGKAPAWVNALQEADCKHLFVSAPEFLRRFLTLLDPGVWSALLLAAGVLVLLRFTVFGRYCYAVGSNEATARLCGVHVERNKLLVYTLAGLLTGWAGVLAFAHESGGGSPSGQVGLELEVIAAAVIGGASLRGGRGTVVGVLLGVLLLGVLNDGATRCGAIVEVKLILTGVIVVANTALSQWQRKRSG